MTFLTRQADQAVMIGDDIRVVVTSIARDHVVLSVAYVDEHGQRVEQTCSLERDDRVEIVAGTAVHVMDIRSDRVRLGVVAPDERPVTRQEYRADAPRPASSAKRKAKSKPAATVGKRHRTHRLVVAVDQPVRVGLQMSISLTDLDAGGVRMLIDGELVGGPDDGLRVREARELRIGNHVELGTQVQVLLEAADATRATLAITLPTHVDVGVA